MEEADRIVQVLTEVAQAGTNVIAVADDAYFGLFFEDNVLKESVFARLAGAHPRLLAVKLDGATKENYVWGFVSGSSLTDAARKRTLKPFMMPWFEKPRARSGAIFPMPLT